MVANEPSGFPLFYDKRKPRVVTADPWAFLSHLAATRLDKHHEDIANAYIAQGNDFFEAAQFKWEVLHNPIADSPFFTSDFPVAIEATDDPRILNRIVPLAPTLALRIRPDLTLARSRSDFSFSKFGCQRRDLVGEEVAWLNRLIVRCAEETVFYRDDHPWVRPFVSENRHYRLEPCTQRIASPTGTLLVFGQRIVAAAAPAGPTSMSAG